MPELPEIEIAARLLGEELVGATVDSVLAPGVNVVKSVEPPLSELVGMEVVGVRRRGKHFIVDFRGAGRAGTASGGDGVDAAASQGEGGGLSEGGELSLLVHLMSAGRLQLYEKRASPKDRTSRLLVRLALKADGGSGPAGAAGMDDRGRRAGDAPAEGRERSGEVELRLREFGSRQMAWVKLVETDTLENDRALSDLGPEAWPLTPPLDDLLGIRRQLHTVLRDQKVIAGIGRSWADEILWEAKLPPFKRGADLDSAELEALRKAIGEVLGGAIDHYAGTVKIPIPDKMPMPLRVHRHEGEPCPRCGSELQAVHFSDHVVAYCPTCQTGGQTLKDRRLSRLLK